MNDVKSSSIFEALKDADVKDVRQYKMFFDSLNISNHLGAVQVIEKSDGSGKIIRFGFFNKINKR